MARRGGRIPSDVARGPGSPFSRRAGNNRRRMKQIEDNLKQALEGKAEDIAETLNEEGHFIEKISNKNAPKDTGELRSSSYVETEAEDKEVRTTIGYMADHAIYTHEIGPYKNPTTPGTNWKYLERAVKERESFIRQRLKREHGLKG